MAEEFGRAATSSAGPIPTSISSPSPNVQSFSVRLTMVDASARVEDYTWWWNQRLEDEFGFGLDNLEFLVALFERTLLVSPMRAFLNEALEDLYQHSVTVYNGGRRQWCSTLNEGSFCPILFPGLVLRT